MLTVNIEQRTPVYQNENIQIQQHTENIQSITDHGSKQSSWEKRIAALHLQIIFGTRQSKEKPRNSVNKMKGGEKKSIRHAYL